MTPRRDDLIPRLRAGPGTGPTPAVDLAARADVTYARHDSPLGSLLLAATSRGLVRVAYEHEDVDDVLRHLAERVSPRIVTGGDRLDAARRELDEYFAGRRHDFALDVDWSFADGFARRVLRATARIPYGATRTYREVARSAGNDRATRAAGNALGSNWMPVVIPCHRVLRTGGGLGGYGGGLGRKRFLLDLEGAGTQ